MHRALVVLLVTAAPVLAAELPQDVAAFVARRERCDHFRGEEAEDPARLRAIGRGLEVNCRGTDAELQRLKQRYAGHRGIRAQLDGYDLQME